MFIFTNTTTEKWITQTVFDTTTGLRYHIFIDRQPALYMNSVKVNIESAHVVSGENDYLGITYVNLEAVNFWLQLGASLPGADVELFDWVLFEANEALVKPDKNEATGAAVTTYEDELSF